MWNVRKWKAELFEALVFDVNIKLFGNVEISNQWNWKNVKVVCLVLWCCCTFHTCFSILFLVWIFQFHSEKKHFSKYLGINIQTLLDIVFLSCDGMCCSSPYDRASFSFVVSLYDERLQIVLHKKARFISRCKIFPTDSVFWNVCRCRFGVSIQWQTPPLNVQDMSVTLKLYN